MANSKLTLSADKEVIDRAKRFAHKNQTSVSAMFTRFLSAMTSDQSASRKLGPITRKATGLITIPANKKDRQLLEEALAEKHRLPL